MQFNFLLKMANVFNGFQLLPIFLVLLLINFSNRCGGNFQFPTFSGEYPYMGIILIPWNYSPCVLLAGHWCMTHNTPLVEPYLKDMSMQNPYKVMLGHIALSVYEPDKNQACLAVKSIFHPNSMITIVLIKVKPEIQITLFVDYQQLRFNGHVQVNEDCEVMYWTQVKITLAQKKHFFFDYELVSLVPCPYDVCHYSEDGTCPVEHLSLVDVSAAIVCKSHLMGFAEFGRDNMPGVVYHKITQDVIDWLMSLIVDEV